MIINALAVDLSHHDPASDYAAVKAAGIVGVIYKATEGAGWTDSTYVTQQRAAKSVGLKWGAYHFADASDVDAQINNFMRFACPDPDELFCLDWEDNPTGNGCMSLGNVERWVSEVERMLGRPGQCVIYSGNVIKEKPYSSMLAERRLWLCQYGSTPELPDGYEDYWMWQFTDGVYGPQPHSIPGIGPCDINHFDGTPQQLAEEWATGKRSPQPAPGVPTVSIALTIPAGIDLKITVNGDTVLLE